ncbi:MAG: hypothetical protein HOO96_41455 [Polyangiaceae bacterium]|nr:hypothetical protein [Polyangiaceae bacterium]
MTRPIPLFSSLVLLGACAATAQPASGGAAPLALPVATVETIPVPAPSTVPELDAGRAAIPSPDAAPPGDNAALAVSPACRGTTLSLDAILARKDCDVLFHQRELPAPSATSITLSAAAAAPAVPRAGKTTIVLTMTNASPAPVAFDVDLACGEAVAFPTEVFDAKGNRADYLFGGCGGIAMGCERKVVRVALEPGGTATKNLAFRPTVTRLTKGCRPHRGGRLLVFRGGLGVMSTTLAST